MSINNIELELRAEVPVSILKKLQDKVSRVSRVKRLSVMYFGNVNGHKLDIRVRINNDTAELVIKKGNLHASDRIEYAIPVNKDQFIKFVEVFSLFNFKTEVAEREIYDFDMGRNITLSFMKAGNIAYVEIEKMSSPATITKNYKELLNIAHEWKFNIIKTEKAFNSLCSRLSHSYDWSFSRSKDDFRRLRKLLRKY